MRILVDMDGVIANWTDLAIERAKFIFNVDIKREDITRAKFADFLRKTWAKNKGVLNYSDARIYEKICHKEFYYEIKPFDGAIDAVKEVQADNNEIVFLTKPTDWRNSSFHKSEWLKTYFTNMPYTIIMINRMEDKHMIYAPVIVDDDPRALKDHPFAIPVCIKQPWNKEFRESDEVMLTVLDDIKELPKTIKFIKELIDEESRLPF